MEQKEAINVSRKRKLVSDSKFDRHMKKARLLDIENRRKIFILQTENGVEKMVRNMNVQSSIY